MNVKVLSTITYPSLAVDHDQLQHESASIHSIGCKRIFNNFIIVPQKIILTTMSFGCGRDSKARFMTLTGR